MKRTDFQFDLPPELIASYPTEQRNASRLLLLANGKSVSDHHFVDLPGLLKAGDLLVFNNSKVIPARAFGNKETGGKVEVLLERVLPQRRALVKLKASKTPKPGTSIHLLKKNPVIETDQSNNENRANQHHRNTEQVELVDRQDDLFCLQFECDPLSYFQDHGDIPLPPYIERGVQELDQARYQTVYAQNLGSVAAPTAGLHFDQPTFEALSSANIDWGFVTLHVGSGTYQPVRVDDISEHKMHAETVTVSDELVNKIEKTKQRGGRIIAVGTTSLRSLEAASQTGPLMPFSGETNIFIYPGYRFKAVDALLTNFHLPESTLLMLVCALAGHQRVLAAYQHAIEERYRFFSYGDCMLIETDYSELQ